MTPVFHFFFSKKNALVPDSLAEGSEIFCWYGTQCFYCIPKGIVPHTIGEARVGCVSQVKLLPPPNFLLSRG